MTQPERLPVKALRLSTAERRAITLRSISATADGSLGVIVTATFQGNVERYLGQGDLANGRVALTLTPDAPAKGTATLVDERGGFTPVRVPIRRHGRVHAQTVDVFSPERVLHKRTPPEAGVVRNGSQIVFYLGPSALSRLAGVELEIFAGGAGRPTETARLAVDQTQLSYTQLAAPRDALNGLASRGIDPELRAQKKAYATVAQALRRQRHLPPLTRKALTADLARTSRRKSRLTNQAGAVNRLVAQLNALIAARTPPPPPPPTPPAPPPPPAPNVQVVQTDSALSQNMAAQPGLTTSSTPPQGVEEMINVNDQVRYQTFRGLGAAMTDSSAYVINGMASADRTTLIQNLFGQLNAPSTTPAIHLNFLRVGIGATGAMTVGSAYSYDDNPPGGTDPNLDQFDISHDASYIIPTLQQVLQANPGLDILANPWSPPAWMKNNNSLGNSNHAGDLLTQYYQSYAEYFVKFIQAYTTAGVPIDAITPANEPTSGSGGSGYPGLNFPESDEAQFVANNLKPALDQAGLHPKIYGNDLSWDRYAGYASPLASDANAGPALTGGIAWHCYFGSPTVMSQLHQTNPALDQIVDECSPEIRGFGTPEFLISTLRNWASVVAAWSVVLEPNGQPIQTPNSCGGCRGLVSVDPATGAVTYRTEYYQFGQVSAFVQPGAQRIDSQNFVTYGTNGSNIETISSGLDDVAFLNPDGSKVLVAYNNSSAPITFGVASDGGYFSYTIPAGAMTTFAWR